MGDSDKGRRFDELMRREGLSKLTKRVVYIVRIKYPDPKNPIIEKFTSEKERSAWYQIIGRGIEIIAQVPVELDEQLEE